MLVCSSGAGVSSGGMVMDRLGGVRLCRRLLDTEETLSPFLSAEAMAGRGAGWLEKRQGGTGVLRPGWHMGMHVHWLGIEPATFWFAGQCSIH